MTVRLDTRALPSEEASGIPWLRDRTVLYVFHGSRAYGTSRPDSDFDYKGVCVPPREYRDGFLHRFEQAEIKAGLDDATIYEIRKFFALAAECNPNIIEVLWADDEALIHCTEAGGLIREARGMFLSKKAHHTFRGYAMSQLKRIETHRKWLLDPPDHDPARREFDLPEIGHVVPKEQMEAAMAAIRKKIDSWEIDFGDLNEPSVLHIQEQMVRTLAEIEIGDERRFWAAGRWIGLSDNFVEALVRERRYLLAKKNWDQYLDWKAERNPERASLEARYGYDCKHGGHLVRLLRMCEEILRDGKVLVRRPDADEIRSVRDGAWSYDHLMEWARGQEARLLEAAKASPLPPAPDRERLDDLCVGICEAMR